MILHGIYGKELRQAYQNGVEIMVYDVAYDLKQGRVRLRNQIPFQL
jgi:DNA-binding sugar fermentation-stimulating protein